MVNNIDFHKHDSQDHTFNFCTETNDSAPKAWDLHFTLYLLLKKSYKVSPTNPLM